jgi:hypothetical protein
MYTGAEESPYKSNIPPWEVFVDYLKEHGLEQQAELILRYLG